VVAAELAVGERDVEASERPPTDEATSEIAEGLSALLSWAASGNSPHQLGTNTNWLYKGRIFGSSGKT
jgi:hypothetical protein